MNQPFSRSDIPQTLQVCETGHNERIDRFLAQSFPLYSRSFFQRLVEQSCIEINSRVIDKPSFLIKHGDIITINFPAPRTIDLTNPAIKNIGISVVYEHNHFFILNKPAHVLVHPAPNSPGVITVVDWLLTEHQELYNVGYVDRPGIVHRLDKDTSGLLIIPRTNYAHTIFGALFKDRKIHKTYHAIVQGHPVQKTGLINFAIGRDPATKVKMKSFPASPGTRGGTVRNASTHYTVIDYLNDAALLELKPVTGRTHQIRVHCAAIGHAIIGDHIYGIYSPLIERQALHASALSFTFEEQNYSFSTPLPEDMEKLMQKLIIKK